MNRSILITVFLFISIQSWAQVFTNKEVGKKNADLADSLKKSDYPYVLPIWGEKATKLGYNLPYSAGVSTQYFWQESELIIDNLMVGFNNGPMYNVDELIRFNKAQATAQAVTVRPDVWLLPFLDVYGIFGKSSASTIIGAGLWLPDSNNISQEVLSFNTQVDFKATTFGLGMTPTIGIGGGFLALDMNVAWTDVPQLDKPAFTFVFGPRLGKNFKLKKPERNIALWVGGFRVKLNSGTSGSVNLGDVFPIAEWEQKVENANAKVAEKQQNVDAWWAGLTPAEQRNPVNVAKYNTANAALTKAGQIISSAENAVNNAGNASVQYSMDKRPKDMWNFIIGSQLQLNKHWMLRAEYGFLNSRTQFLTGLQYRFGL